jgi:hypothetical protein
MAEHKTTSVTKRIHPLAPLASFPLSTHTDTQIDNMAVKKAPSVVASDVYPLIHALLVSSGMKAAAAALQKETKLVRPLACLFVCLYLCVRMRSLLTQMSCAFVCRM